MNLFRKTMIVFRILGRHIWRNPLPRAITFGRILTYEKRKEGLLLEEQKRK